MKEKHERHMHCNSVSRRKTETICQHEFYVWVFFAHKDVGFLLTFFRDADSETDCGLIFCGGGGGGRNMKPPFTSPIFRDQYYCS